MATARDIEVQAKLAWVLLSCQKFADFMFLDLFRTLGLECRFVDIQVRVDGDKWRLLSESRALTQAQVLSVCVHFKGSSVAHQCAMFTKDNVWYLYDPYGTFEKLGKSYLEAFQQYARSVLPSATIKIYRGDIPIQTMMVEFNNKRHPEFWSKYNKALATLPRELLQSIHTKLAEPKLASELQADIDKNRVVMEVIPLLPDDHVWSFLAIFREFSSKLCVSITIVELCVIFGHATELPSPSHFYELFRDSKKMSPNEVILTILQHLFTKHSLYPKLSFYFQQPLRTICESVNSTDSDTPL